MTLTDSEIQLVQLLEEKLIGSAHDSTQRSNLLLENVKRRMGIVKASSLSQYLKIVDSQPEEFSRLLSALTIHTTSWFREAPHFDFFAKQVKKMCINKRHAPMRLLCVGCSTGQEVYSFALLLDKLSREIRGLDFEIIGLDVDPVSVNTGQKCVYPLEELSQIPREYWTRILKGSGKTDGLFTIDKEIRRRCHFAVKNVLQLTSTEFSGFDYVTARNFLIYFSPENVNNIVRNMVSALRPGGILILGHSETDDAKAHGLLSLGRSCHQRLAGQGRGSEVVAGVGGEERLKRLLIIDDSKTIRAGLTKLAEKSFEVFQAENTDAADKILAVTPVDMITLDLHMPGKDGLTWLQEQRHKNNVIPVVVISDTSEAEAVNVLGAMEKGAQDFFEKRTLQVAPQEVLNRLEAIAEGSLARKHQQGKSQRATMAQQKLFRPSIILIGASTGGTEALQRILRAMPGDCPPIVVVQHISKSFLRPFAERLAATATLTLGAGRDGEILQPGHIYLALDDYHISVQKQQNQFALRIKSTPPLSGHRPAVDTLFFSAKDFASEVRAVILTGMGRDGADGMRELKRGGAITFAQDEDSCVVFGMPKEAIASGGAGFIGTCAEIRREIDRALVIPLQRKLA